MGLGSSPVTVIILLHYVFFSSKIKQKDLIVEKSKKQKEIYSFSVVSALTSDPVDSFFDVAGLGMTSGKAYEKSTIAVWVRL